jgi:hypothetical protein
MAKQLTIIRKLILIICHQLLCLSFSRKISLQKPGFIFIHDRWYVCTDKTWLFSNTLMSIKKGSCTYSMNYSYFYQNPGASHINKQICIWSKGLYLYRTVLHDWNCMTPVTYLEQPLFWYIRVIWSFHGGCMWRSTLGQSAVRMWSSVKLSRCLIS